MRVKQMPINMNFHIVKSNLQFWKILKRPWIWEIFKIEQNSCVRNSGLFWLDKLASKTDLHMKRIWLEDTIHLQHFSVFVLPLFHMENTYMYILTCFASLIICVFISLLTYRAYLALVLYNFIWFSSFPLSVSCLLLFLTISAFLTILSSLLATHFIAFFSHYQSFIHKQIHLGVFCFSIWIQ